MRGGGHEFIAYLDDDDEWLPEKLEKQLAKFNECGDDVAAVSCSWIAVNEETHKSVLIDSGQMAGSRSIFRTSLSMGPVSVPLLRTKCVVSVGGFNKDINTREDWELWLRLMKRYNQAFIHDALFVYHDHSGDRLTKSFARMIQAHEYILSEYFSVIEEDMSAYRDMLISTASIYAEAGKIGRSTATYFKFVNVKPFMIISNIRAFLRVISGYMKFSLKTISPKLFGRLRNIKHKLKGRKDN